MTVPPMLQITLRRLVWSIPLVLLASAATFVMVAFLPGDAAQSLAGRTATQPQIDQVRMNLGLDRPLLEQYVGWLKDALHGDLGSSMINRQPVTMILNGRLASSLSLIMGVTVLATIIGVAIGTFGARRGRIGRAIDGGSIIGLAVPDFWLGLMLIVVFAVNLGWFPPTGYVPWGDGIGDWLRSITLPVITLAVPAVALIAKQTRDAMSAALGGEYVRTLRAAGVRERSIVIRHGLRNAANPILTVIGLVFIGALSGTVAVESVFAIQGLGSAAVQATANRDLPVIQGVVVYFTLIVVAVNLVVDLAYSWFDPRVRSA